MRPSLRNVRRSTARPLACASLHGYTAAAAVHERALHAATSRQVGGHAAPAIAQRGHSTHEQAQAAPSGADFTDAGTVIVGGGPAGCAAAIALANQGMRDIVILESAASASDYDPTKAFTFALHRQGKHAIEALGIHDIEDWGTTIPVLQAIAAMPDGSVQRWDRVEAQGAAQEGDRKLQFTLIQRSVLDQRLEAQIQECHADAVQIKYGRRVTGIHIPSQPGKPLLVHTASAAPHDPSREQRGAEPPQTLRCQLLIGADGLTSTVRKELVAKQPGRGWEPHEEEAGIPTGNKCWKTVQFESLPYINEAVGRFQQDCSLLIQGRKVDGHDTIRFGLLPGRPSEPCTAAIAAFPDHPIWEVATSDALYAYLRRVMPQVEDWGKLLRLDVAERFVAQRPGFYKNPMATQRLVYTCAEAAMPDNEHRAAESMQGIAVVILGDAAHCHPPDFGQGVNAALMDVHALHMRLAETPHDLLRALHQFEKDQLPEHKALVNLHAHGTPGHYRQNVSQLVRQRGRFNVWLRAKLSALLPALFAPQLGTAVLRYQPPPDVAAGNLIANPATFYQDIMAKAHRTTALIAALGIAIAAAAASMLLWLAKRVLG